jgi:hypothetical protein
MDKIIKTIFCANEQVETTHVLSASPSGEVCATCEVCGRVLKFPAGVSRKEFDDLVAAHQEANQGQVTVESIEKTLAELADAPVKVKEEVPNFTDGSGIDEPVE